MISTAEISESDYSKRYVLIYLNGAAHWSLFKNFFEKLPDIEWVVLIETNGSTILKLVDELNPPDNVTFIHYLHDVYLRIDVFCAVVTTFAVPHGAHVKGIQLFHACSMLGIPVFEIQHGLFQVGISYQEKARVVGHGYYGAASTLPVTNFRDHLLAWWGKDSIGYPPNCDLLPPANKGYVLILSNLHWNIFGPSEQRAFFESLTKLVTAYPGIPFVWKPHPVEISSRMEPFFNPFLKGQFPNVKLLTNAKMAEQKLTTGQLVRECDFAITSFSTVLLEIEMYGKGALVYSPRCCDGLRGQIELCSTFATPDELLSQFSDFCVNRSATGAFRSGLLEPFRPNNLREMLLTFARKTRPGKADVASVIIPLLHRLLYPAPKL